MDYLTTSCRSLLKASDRDFVFSVFLESGESPEVLEQLAEDSQAYDSLLEDERLFQAIVDSPVVVPFSSALYFYVLARRALSRFGLDSRDLADYVAVVLMNYLEPHESVQDGWPHLYWVDFLESLEGLEGGERFYKTLDWANSALFITGVFPDYVEKRVNRSGAPSLSFYESVGASCFRMVEGHALAGEFNLREVFSALGEGFSRARQALNVLRDRMIFIRYPIEIDVLGGEQEGDHL